MGALQDLYSNVKLIPLHHAGNQTGSAFYSYYIDTTGLDVIGFGVATFFNTASVGNGYTPAVYGYTGDTPGTATNYSACAAAELDGEFSQIVTQDTMGIQMVSLKQHLYKYYHVKMTEAGTADAEVAIFAIVGSIHQPSSSLAPTTGAVS